MKRKTLPFTMMNTQKDNNAQKSRLTNMTETCFNVVIYFATLTAHKKISIAYEASVVL